GVTVNSNGSNIQKGAITGGGQTLDLNAGATGTITLASGDNISTLTIVNSNGTTVTGNYGQGTPGAVTITDTAAGQTVDFQGNTHITTLGTTANGYNVSLIGTSNTVDTATSFLNTGSVTLGNGTGDSTTFTGGVNTH